VNSEEEKKIIGKSETFAKKNRTNICRRLTCKTLYFPEDFPVSVFMSGSPGAGKTETSKELISAITKAGGNVLRLDPDDLRSYFEDYNGSNSFLFQRGVTLIVERALDFIFKNNQSFLLDLSFRT
jgi:UDP-N-acetylglucosamine kinase